MPRLPTKPPGLAPEHSQADQRLDQPPDPTFKFYIALQCHHTKTDGAVFHRRIVVVGFVSLVEISRPETAEVVAERALKNACPFGSGMAMSRQAGPRTGFEHKCANIAPGSNIDRAQVQARPNPSPRTRRVMRQRRGQI